MQRIGKSWVLACVAVTLTGLSAGTANAARLGHPAYSAAAATTAQRQVNLVCDPVGAETGSTSTMYDPGAVNLNTITALPGFQLDEVDVLENGEGTFTEQFILAPGTTAFVITHGEVALASAISTGSPTTYYAFLSSSEAGAVQVFWSPSGSGGIVPSAVTNSSDRHGNNGGGGGGDVNTHLITFDIVTGTTSTTTTLTNYANGNAAFPVYFDQFDGYSGPRFSYTADQIQSASSTVRLTPDCGNGHGRGDHDDHRDRDDHGHKHFGPHDHDAFDGYGKGH